MTAKQFDWDNYTPKHDVSIGELDDWMRDESEFGVEAMDRIYRWWRAHPERLPLITFITQEMYATAMNQAQACGHTGQEGPMGPTLLDAFQKIMGLGKESLDIEQWTASEVLCKLFEEGGELSTAMLIETGKMPHKQLKQPDEVYEEAADVIICVLDALAKIYPDQEDNITINKLLNWLYTKMKKWNDKVLVPQSETLKNSNLEVA